METTSNIDLQCLLGMQCSDFVMLAADQTFVQSIVIMKNDTNKLYEITDKMVIGAVGDEADRVRFVEFVSQNLDLYQKKNGYGLNTAATVHFVRKNLAENFKKRLSIPRGQVLDNEQESWTPTIINMLIGGYDSKGGPQLYTLDALGSCMKVPYAVHGYGGILSLGILDRYHRNSLNTSEAYKILMMCVKQIHQRLLINLPNFQVKVISKNGIYKLPTINSASFSTSK